MEPKPENYSTINLRLTVESDRLSLFSSLLGQGFTLKVRTGCSLRELLCEQLGVHADYVDQRIQTIFLDGKTVDDVDTAVIRQESTLALSAAMPGLAGATLRRGGAYAAMRRQISHQNTASHNSVANGVVMLKLFNLVALELGPGFLKQGIWIRGKHMENFFKKVPDYFWPGCRAAEIDGTPLKVEEIGRLEWRRRQVFLKLEFKESG
ncbi:MAG: hypothetical protein JRI82_08130 [Deltaproteobacteria bacterium]|nr:hypothetical protein [Deltaproteobacteria bacterium]